MLVFDQRCLWFQADVCEGKDACEPSAGNESMWQKKMSAPLRRADDCIRTMKPTQVSGAAVLPRFFVAFCVNYSNIAN
jgi:hypothetical protein